ncbi:MAG: hypothetical protein ACTSPB_01160 [Candidatus Thorarchaeota archaeon]
MENNEREAYWSWIDFLGTDVDDHVWHTHLYMGSIGLIKVPDSWRWWCDGEWYLRFSSQLKRDR